MAKLHKMGRVSAGAMVGSLVVSAVILWETIARRRETKRESAERCWQSALD